MYQNIKPLFFRAISGVHAGTGSDLGLVDLPIQRERHTGLPKIESSGVKGCLREEFERIEQQKELPGDFVSVAFGPDNGGEKHGGSIAFTDARLLLFPIRSAKGVFAYATCPYILRRLKEDFSLAGIAASTVAVTDKAQVSGERLLISQSGKVILEEYTLAAEPTESARELSRQIAGWLELEDSEYLRENLIILPDDQFKDFVKNSTEIITRTKIGETGTVVKGALFTEEFLPAETVMYSLVMTAKIFIEQEARAASQTVIAAREAGGDEGKYLLETIMKKMPDYIQLGGDATVGKGLCRVSSGKEV